MPIVCRSGPGVALVAAMAIGASACADPGADRVERLRVASPETHWADAGFVRLEPPTHLPSSDPDIDQVEVWIRLPPSAVLRTVDGPDGPSLELPPGTELDRVELAGTGDARRVVDVRGATIDDDGSATYRVLRRESGRPGAALFGVAWPADDEDAHAAATEALLDGLARTAELRAMDHADAQRTLQSIRSKNACAGCHAPSQAAATRAGERTVARGTDASGFYVPVQMLSDSAPLETYGAFDRSLADPFIAVRCPRGTAEIVQDPRSHAVCPDGAVPVGRLSLASALAGSDARAQNLCRGRDYLVAHLDETGRRAFADAIAACGLRTDNAMDQGTSPP
jgi:hypothetical protein